MTRSGHYPRVPHDSKHVPTLPYRTDPVTQATLFLGAMSVP
jgi:hypothetical protein